MYHPSQVNSEVGAGDIPPMDSEAGTSGQGAFPVRLPRRQRSPDVVPQQSQGWETFQPQDASLFPLSHVFTFFTLT